MTKQEALIELARNPSQVVNHFGITKEEYLDALTDKDLEARRREAGNLYGDLSLIRLPHAVQLLGIPKERIEREAPICDWGKRNQKISHNALLRLIQQYTTTPPGWIPSDVSPTAAPAGMLAGSTW